MKLHGFLPKSLFILAILLPSAGIRTEAQNGVLPFLDMEVNARTAGMSGAGSVCRDNPLALYANMAAALGGDNIAGGAIFAGPWRTSFAGADVVYGGSAFYRPGRKNFISAGFRYISGEKMTIMDENGYMQGYMRPVDWALDFGYGRLFGDKWSVALNARWVRSDAGYGEGASDVAIFALHGAYLGSFHDVKRGNWTAGLSVKGLGTPLKSNGVSNMLPIDVTAAGNVEILWGKKHSLSFSADLDLRVIPSMAFSAAVGAEYMFLRHGVVRAGYCAYFSRIHDGIQSYSNAYDGYASIGCGLVFGPFRCDVAWRFHNDRSNPLNASSVFSVSLLF